MANRAKIFFVFLLLTSLLLAEESIPAMEHKKIVEANHYYSDSEKEVTYSIANVEKARSLIFVLRDKTTSQASLPINKNHISIKLKSGSTISDCLFDSYDDLCVIKEIEDNTSMNLQIKCQTLPCDLSWTIFQPIAKVPTKSQQLQELYELSDSNKHMIAIISCNDPAIKTFYNDVKIYSNNPFTLTQSNEVIYYLFNNQKKGYMFAEVQKGSKHCANLAIYNVSDMITVTDKVTIKDFVRNDSLSVFKLNEVPSSDFMIDASVHELDKTQIIKSGLELKLTGETGGNRETIQSYAIRPFVKKTQFDFKVVVKKISEKYKNIQIQYKSTGSVIMINFVVAPQNRHQIQMGEISYVHLKKDEKIMYKVVADPQAAQDKIAYVYVSNKNSLSVNQTQCKLKSGCQFEIIASNDVEGSLYLGQSKQQNQQQIIYTEFKRAVTKKGKQGDIHYFKTPLQGKKAFQMVVNSPNVIVHGAVQGHCPQPSENCYEKVFNFHHPTIFEPEKSGSLILAVSVLDNCQYTLTRVNQDDEYIDLKQGVPFSYLMDDQQQKLVFRFKIDKKQMVHFDLVSPLNSLYLLVQNGNKVPSVKQMNIASTDGYISFDKSEVKELEFTILIQKTEDHLKKFVHFSLIASTTNTNMRLDSGVPHYQTFSPEQHKDYVFEFQPKEEYIVNFYTQNAKAKQKINIEMMLSNNDEWTNIPKQHSFIIDKAADVLQLKDISESLCQKQGSDECQIFIRIINTMDSEIDITLSLLVKNSIIELKDGLWQSYAQNTVATSSNFYFYPKHEQKSIEILYKSVFTDLRIAYTIWKADEKNIDPTQWPFPRVIPKESSQSKVVYFRPTKHVSIDRAILKQCWPSCVVLISLIKNSTEVQGEFQNTFIQNGEFSIMASNNYIEIPQKTKIEVVLKQNQMKFFMIDLKYALEKQDSALTIFTSSTIGFYELKANVYSEKNPRCPTQSDESDFRFGNLQTQIKISTIQKKIQENEMGDDRNVYICIMAKAYTNTKLSFEYTSSEDTIKVLDMDSFETVNVDKGIIKLYQVSANQQYYIKFTRNKGFPFVDFSKCNQDSDYEECLEKLVESKEKGKQLVTKTQSFSEKPCAKCIIFIKISAEQPAEIDVHLQSKYTQMQLKQNRIISDFTNQNEENRYTLTALREQDTIINIQVTEGNVEAILTDFNKVNVTKKNDKDKSTIHIVIPAQDHQHPAVSNNMQVLGLPWMTQFGLSQTFTYLHLTIKASDGKGATAYTISYSSGARETYLQDGLITDYVLEPSKETTFFYENKNAQSHGYLSISMENSANLHNVELKMSYLTDPNDEETAVQINAQKPPMRKKTPNPTIIYSIPGEKFIVIKMTNPSNAEEKVSIGINHQQVILLPFDHQFPFPLHKKEQINLLVDVNNPGFLKLTIKKCDESNPQFSYTFDYEGFQNGQFTYTSVLNDDPKFQYIVKVKQVGTLYINFKSQEEIDSLISIRAEYSAQKIKSSTLKPGNKGLLQYQLLDSATAQLTFTEVSCTTDSGACRKEFDYFTISAKAEQQLYSQTVCPANYFSTTETQSTDPLPLNKIKANTDSNGKITFQYTLLDHISYVGVKGINAKTGEQVYYRPIEIVTIWGQISRTSTSHKFTIIGISLCFLTTLLIWCRRQARKGYKPLMQDD